MSPNESARQIASSRQAEQLLGKERDFIVAVLDTVGCLVIVLDRHGRIVRFNRACEQLTGRSFAEVKGTAAWKSFLVPGERAEVEAVVDELAAGHFPNEHENYWLAKDGGRRLIAWSNTALLNDVGGVDYVIATGIDITERRRAEQELEHRVAERTAELARANARLEADRRTLQTMVDQMPEGVFFAEAPDGRVIIANEAARRLLGRDVPPGTAVDREGARLGFFRPDGQAYAPQDLPISRALAGESVTRQEVLIRRPDLSEVTVMVNCARIETRGGVDQAVAVFQDVSPLKEVARLKEEFIHLISHDLRNPLTVVMSQAQWLGRQLLKREDEPHAKSADAILKSARRMDAMISDLVESTHLESGHGRLRKTPTDLLRLAEDIVERVGSREDRSRIGVESPQWVPLVAVDPGQIERALVNLVSNALKYSPVSAAVRVHLEQRQNEAVVSVSDCGVGIPAEEIPFLFERFYRASTGRKAEGLGLGLYITRLIIEAHNGRIWVDSQPGVGSTFHVALPIDVSQSS